MILSTQPITRLVLLIMIFIKSAILFLLLDYYFLGLTYIIVYVGAIAILFLFVIMMAETHVTPKVCNFSTKNELITILPDSLKVVTTSGYKLRIPKCILNSKAHRVSEHLAKGLGLGQDPRSTTKNSELIIIKIKGIISSYNFFDFHISGTFHDIWNYHIVNYSSEFITFTDIQSLGFLLYLAFPFLTVFLGIILWVVLVGILRISTNN